MAAPFQDAATKTMNVYLKSALQNLDCEIKRLSDIRDQLLNGADAATVPIVQTSEQTQNVSSQRRRGAEKKQKRGGHREKTEAREPVATPAPAREDDRSTSVLGKAPTTVAGAMKLEIAGRGGKEFTSDDLRTALEAKYGGEGWWKNASASALSGNLSYWSSKGRLEKTATGYRALEKEFFANVEY